MTETIRAFIAVELTDEVKQALTSVARALQSQVPSGVRWVSPEAMHLTLKFLGQITPSQVEPVIAAMRRATQGVEPFQVSLNGVGAFPNARAPRVLWVDLADGAQRLRDLAQALEEALAALGFPREARSFSPHLTLGRIRDSHSQAERERLAGLLQRPPPVPAGAMRVESISLIRSELRPEGPQYTRLHQVKLGGTQ